MFVNIMKAIFYVRLNSSRDITQYYLNKHISKVIFI